MLPQILVICMICAFGICEYHMIMMMKAVAFFVIKPKKSEYTDNQDYYRSCLTEQIPGYKKNFTLDSAEHEIFPAHKC